VENIDFLNETENEYYIKLNTYKQDWVSSDELNNFINTARSGHRYDYLISSVEEFRSNYAKDKYKDDFYSQLVQNFLFEYSFLDSKQRLTHISDYVLYLYLMSKEEYRVQYIKNYNKKWFNIIPMSDLKDIYLLCKFYQQTEQCYGIELIEPFFDTINHKELHKHFEMIRGMRNGK